MNPMDRLITADNWACIQRDYPDIVPILEDLNDDYGEDLAPGLKKRINELVMAWLKMTKQEAEKTAKEKKYQFQIRTLKQQHHQTTTELQEQLRKAIQSSGEATQQEKSNAEKLKTAEEKQQVVKQELEKSQKISGELAQQLASSQAEVVSLQKQSTTVKEDLEKLQNKVRVTADKTRDLGANISSASRGKGQQQAVKILNHPKLIENLTRLIELTEKISRGLDATKDRINDILQAGKEQVEDVQEAISSTSKSVLDVALMVAAVPIVLWTLYQQQLNSWQILPPRERFKKLCDTISCDPKNIKTIYPVGHPIYESLNWIERLSGSYTKCVGVTSYPILRINQCLRKKFPDFSCTLLKEEKEFYDRRDQDLRDCHSLEIINSEDLGHEYSIHDMHRYLKPNRVIKDVGCMTMQGLHYNVWGLGLQNVREVYLLVRFPDFFPKMSITSLPCSLIQKLYRHSVMHNREGCGRDEFYSVRDSYQRDIGASYDALHDPSAVYMYSVADYSQQRCSLLNICELAIWEGIEVLGFIVHRHSSDAMFLSSSCQPDDYFNWENIHFSERYAVLKEFLKAKDADFAQAFNRRFSTSSCFYLSKNYKKLQHFVSYQLHPNIQLKLDNDWKISDQYITSLDRSSSLTLNITRVEKIFLIVDTASTSNNWEKNTIDITVSRIIDQDQRDERNREALVMTNKIDINENGVEIHNLVSLIGQSWHSHQIRLTLPAKAKVLGFIMSGKDI